MPVAHAYNPSYSGGRDQEDCGLKPVRANSSRDPILKKPSILPWCLNSGLRTCKAATCLLGPYFQSILLWLFWRWGLHELFARAGLEPQSSQLARTTGVSHQHLVPLPFCFCCFFKTLEVLINQKIGFPHDVTCDFSCRTKCYLTS
jgi:hypothetical protein